MKVDIDGTEVMRLRAGETARLATDQGEHTIQAPQNAGTRGPTEEISWFKGPTLVG